MKGLNTEGHVKLYVLKLAVFLLFFSLQSVHQINMLHLRKNCQIQKMKETAEETYRHQRSQSDPASDPKYPVHQWKKWSQMVLKILSMMTQNHQPCQMRTHPLQNPAPPLWRRKRNPRAQQALPRRGPLRQLLVLHLRCQLSHLLNKKPVEKGTLFPFFYFLIKLVIFCKAGKTENYSSDLKSDMV